MQVALRATVLVASFVVSLVPLVAWIGLGIHRHAPPVAVAGGATFLVYAPPLVVGLLAAGDRVTRTSAVLAGWAASLFVLLPLYFPGERREAVATGLGVLGLGADGLPHALAQSLPEEPAMATPELAEAEPVKAEELEPGPPIGDDQMALPYEGEGRRMSVPVHFSNGGRDVDVDMMFDTGATYTTLSDAVLAKLGVTTSPKDPVIQLHTANGEREAHVVLLDRVWLGDLELDGVAIATCDDCAGPEVGGLLGLNVTGRFNIGIDGDRREVVFTRRSSTDRKLDIKPFTDLDATFTRFPGGRVEVDVRLENQARRDIQQAVAMVRCGDAQWAVGLGKVLAGQRGETRQRLPEHPTCSEYEISLQRASW
jgi:clan AA aspartic protease (TIGR02281 family)